jgi:phosphatidate cytidylyltransferase
VEKKMLWKRIIAALIGIPVLVYILYQSGILLLCTVLILIIFSLTEFKNLVSQAGFRNISISLWLGGVIVPFTVQYNSNLISLAIFIYLVVTVVYYLIKHPYFTPLDLSLSFLGFIYIVGGFTHILLLRELQQGFWLIIYVFVIVWSTDTAAYFVGTLFGKHNLAPAISPKKTWEGFLGGILFSMVTAMILVNVANLQNPMPLLLLTPIISISGQLGDLFESALKRFAGIKDSGYIIPGHGGVLDRFDSTLLAVPFTYHLVIFLERLF